LTMSARSVGKLAAVMARLSSTKDQVAASTLSHVGSVVFAATLRKWIRNMEITQVLIGFCYSSNLSIARRDRGVGIDLQEPKAKNNDEQNFLLHW
jgi:hypothetical protein